jgi:aspartyl-tRNA(Asn)/glutamyl-tRNA(Gln) amidotransferase subunit B
MKIEKSKTADYTLTIGLEIHAELSTKTKMFCNSINAPDESHPNVNVCPVCMGYPGTLPVINKEAVYKVLRLGVAVGGEIADYTEFDRKNYFYPDIPKGYQISQYKNPLVNGGELAGVKLTRIHLEEDTARSLHNFQFPISNFQSSPNDSIFNENSMKIAKLKTENSLLDFNRAGVPLMELVTEPVIHDAETAVVFAKELQLLLTYLEISEANMEKGEMRVEANISVSKSDKRGTKVEVKNINSFKAVGKTIEFEFERQAALLENGEKVVQETRGWDEDRGETFSQRLKESAHDYRYFPDPDLPKLFLKDVPEFDKKILKASLSELPKEKRERYKKDFGLKNSDIEIYIREVKWGRLLEECAGILGDDKKLIQLVSNYITSDLKTPIPAEALSEVICMITDGEISSRGAKDILKIIEEVGGKPRAIAEEKKLIQISDKEVLEKIVTEVLGENQDAPIQFLVGQAMKKSEGRANPIVLKEIFDERLGK